MRDVMTGPELNRATRLLRGGEPWADIRDQFDVAPADIDKYREDLERRAAKPGDAERLPTPAEAEQNVRDRERLDELFHSRRKSPFTTKRAFGGRRQRKGR
jgi:hypothetical protein